MIRITAGRFKGHTVYTPDTEKTRPTQAKLRQALFNSIQSQVPGARCLDLFAGSGALGFEALSRDAKQVVFLEQSKKVSDSIRKTASELKLSKDEWKIVTGEVRDWFPKLPTLGVFDLVFADPPYHLGWETQLLKNISWDELLAPEGLFCLEWAPARGESGELSENLTEKLTKIREKAYGDTVLTTYLRKE